MIDLRPLRYVLTLARHSNYARAADELGISQPALTRAVQSLERRYGVRIFDRGRGGVNLTAAGRSMIDAAAVLVANADDLERTWEGAARGIEGIVCFGMAPMPARALLYDGLLQRLSTTPAVRHDVVVRNVDALWPLLVSGEIEFFVAAEGQIPSSPPVKTETLGQFPVSFIVRPGHPLLKPNWQRGTYPVLVSSRSGSTPPSDLEAYTNGAIQIVEDFEALAQLTAATDAIWQSSAYAIATKLAAGLLCDLPRMTQSEPTVLRIVHYSLDRRTQSQAAIALMHIFREAIRKLAAASAGS